jgi:hypothetical protein
MFYLFISGTSSKINLICKNISRYCPFTLTFCEILGDKVRVDLLVPLLHLLESRGNNAQIPSQLLNSLIIFLWRQNTTVSFFE